MKDGVFTVMLMLIFFATMAIAEQTCSIADSLRKIAYNPAPVRCLR